ncbi:PD-(D/E)XK nuclease family protein [Aquipuribacter sp. SD81]|uniref:PD-(D/E)XK nuclease family protein n=1 Tax=Aquipuribacter sp. SD81 TaxID=3127703 RepID=UPI003018B0D0
MSDGVGRVRLGAVTLTPAQAAVVTTPGRQLVVGAAATGCTTALLAWALGRAGASGPQPLVLVPSRRAAGRARDALEALLPGTVSSPPARTPQSLAWSLLREHALATGAPVPRLVTASELDEVLAELLEGHEPDGSQPGDGDGTDDDGAPVASDGFPRVPGPRWPERVHAGLRRSRAFRDEVRELAARVVEHGEDPAGLLRLARRHRRPEWAAVARLLAEVQQVAGLRGDGGLDPAGTVAEAAELLAERATGTAAWLRGHVAHLGVDDAQDLTPAGWSLVREVVALSADACVVGDPDRATQAFRGAVPAALDDAGRWLSAPGAVVTRHELRDVLGAAPLPAAVSRAVVAELHDLPVPPVPGTGRGGGGGGARTGGGGAGGDTAAVPGADRGRVLVEVCLDEADEAHVVAAHLRGARQRATDPLAWSDMAVLVRSGAAAARLRRALAVADVPVHVPGVRTPLRDEPAVSLLLEAAETAARPELLDPERLERLAVGPVGGADPVRWRRLVRLARGRLAARAGRAVGTDEALQALCDELRVVVAAPADGAHGRAAPLGLPPAAAAPLTRLVEVLRAGARGAAAGVEHCLWGVWDAWGVAVPWRRLALSGGSGADRADADLDAVVALFDVAGAWAERHPTGRLADLAAHVRSRGVGDDRLGGAERVDAVTVTTPAGAVGLRWDLVVVAGVQDGAWPDPRVRGSLLGLPELVPALRGEGPVAPGGTAVHPELRREARRAVLHDELRLFHVAVSRAARELVVTAVDDAAARPSDLVELVRRACPPDASTVRGAGSAPARDTAVPVLPAPARGAHEVPEAVSAAALVARLRRRLLADDAPPDERSEVATSLARLARAGVRGADPSQWSWLHDPGHAAHPAATTGDGPPGDDAPDGGAPVDPPADGGSGVVVSPSSVGRFLGCPLQWYLDGVGARRASETAQGLGTLLHSALEQVPDGDLGAMQRVVDAGWDDLELRGWVSERERARARAMLERLSQWVAEQQQAGVRVLAAEQAVDAALDLPRAGRVRVRGTADRVERLPDGTVRVVDLKTGSTAATKAEAAADPQLELYQLALQAEGTFGEPGGALLLYVGTGTAAATERRQAALDEQRRTEALGRLDDVAVGMAAGRYPARPEDQRCRRCAAAASCPASPQGRRVPPPVPLAEPRPRPDDEGEDRRG